MQDSEFKQIGKRLAAEGLVSANFGNMSIRSRKDFLITRTGSFLDQPGDPVAVPIRGEVPREASSEYRVHRETYIRTKHQAIVHAHPPYAVAMSLVPDELEPRDSEGEMLCPVIPIVSGKPGSEELAHQVAHALAGTELVIARGHGSFAAGKNLEEAYILTSLAEHSSRILWLLSPLCSGW